MMLTLGLALVVWFVAACVLGVRLCATVFRDGR